MGLVLCCLFPSTPCQATVGGIPTFPSFGLDPLSSSPNRHLLIRGGDADSTSDFGWNDTVSRRILWPGDKSSTRSESSPTADAKGVVEQTTSKISRRHHRQRPLEYRDILNCDARQWSRTADETSDGGGDDYDYDYADSSSNSRGAVRERNSVVDADQQSFVDYRGRLDGTSRKLSHSPVVYQYYGRSRIRGNPSDSVHFILLGPNVDHWKAVGQVLASRGFNTIACERLEKGDARGRQQRNEDSPNLVLEVMEALKWKKVIIVGCDAESILAMETAMMLSPDQVVGLVLAGDLAGSNQVAAASGVGELDTFLKRVLDCPFLIVWDGDSPTVVSGASAHKALGADNSGDRCVILGGGSAPHRLKPEQFAWVLTRFVEEKLEISVRKQVPTIKSRTTGSTIGGGDQSMSITESFLRALNLPFGVNTLVSPEGRLLLGRAIAAGLFYITAMRIVVIQYGILRTGLIAIKSRYESIDALTKKSIQAVGAFIVNFGYIPRLLTVKRATDDEEDENRRSGTIVLENPPVEEEKGPIDEVEIKEDVPEGMAVEESDPVQEPSSSQESKDSDDTEKSSKEEIERPPLFKPFFFLDNVVT